MRAGGVRFNPNPAPVVLPSCRRLRQTQNPGNYFWKKSDEHQTYLDFEEQLMIVQELKEQGLVSYPRLSSLPQSEGEVDGA